MKRSAEITYSLSLLRTGEETIPEIKYRGFTTKPNLERTISTSEMELQDRNYNPFKLASEVIAHYKGVETIVQQELMIYEISCRIHVEGYFPTQADTMYVAGFAVVLENELGEERVRYETERRGSQRLLTALGEGVPEKPSPEELEELEESIQKALEIAKNNKN